MSATRTTLNKRMRLIGAESTFDTIFPATVKVASSVNQLPASKAFTNSNNININGEGIKPKNNQVLSDEGDDVEDETMRNSFECHPEETVDFQRHPNVIIHIDIDCFYAQVEELRDPSLRDKPLGIQQKHCVVTSNFKARERGVKKMTMVSEALRICPDLVLVRGEDLTPYRQMSSRVFEVVQRKFPTCNVERLGMDENFLDVTKLVDQRMDQSEEAGDDGFRGCVFPEAPFKTACTCGCVHRLAVGTQLAQELRETLKKEVGITTCAGIAHNKMLAKLAGALNKPNNQTVVVPTRCRDLMVQLAELRSIPGIGQKTESLLKEIRVDSIETLQTAEQNALVLKFGPEMAKKLKDWSMGIDLTPVKASNYRPKSIGLEDSCKPLSVRQDIEDRFRALLTRLLNQVADDGRIPVTIKMTLRKYDAVKKTSHRETKQVNVLPTLFRLTTTPSSGSSSGSAAGGDEPVPSQQQKRLTIIEGGEDKLLRIVMRLFERVIDMRMPFNITLLGLAFSKFQDRKIGGLATTAAASPLASFLIKKDIEVQSVTSLSSDGICPAMLTTQTPSPVSQFSSIGHRFYRERDLETMSDTMSVASDVSTDEVNECQANVVVEPSPKKSRMGLNLIAKRRCFQADPMDCASPSKLRVADLRLNSIDRDRGEHYSHAHPHPLNPQQLQAIQPPLSPVSSAPAAMIVPRCVDPDVFKELPPDVQNELIANWTQKAAATSTAVATTTVVGVTTPSTTAPTAVASTSKGTSSSIARFFITNK